MVAVRKAYRCLPGMALPARPARPAPAPALAAANPCAELLAEIDRFCARHSMSDSAFGLGAANDTKWLFKLRDGRVPRPETTARVRQFMKDYQAK